jgi:hypothetical protein
MEIKKLTSSFFLQSFVKLFGANHAANFSRFPSGNYAIY